MTQCVLGFLLPTFLLAHYECRALQAFRRERRLAQLAHGQQVSPFRREEARQGAGSRPALPGRLQLGLLDAVQPWVGSIDALLTNFLGLSVLLLSTVSVVVT